HGSRGDWKRAKPCATRTVFQPSCRAGRISLSSQSPIITAADGAQPARSNANVKIAGSGFSNPNSKEHRQVETSGISPHRVNRSVEPTDWFVMTPSLYDVHRARS